ncbi:MAG: hypothetical protein J6N76_10340, partial [Lachnospiraceae bacterium]|nr:hypothetical protein [Lachnospiraceae bacterium]
MVMLYYQVTTILSVVFMLIFAWRWLKHIDLGFTVSFIMIPIINVGYLEIAHADSLGAALVGNKITYLGGCFLNIFLMFGVLSLCHFKVSPLFRTILLGMSGVLYAFVLSIGRGRLFYVSADIETVNGVTVITDKVYGPVHGFFYVAAFCLLSANIVIAVYSFKNRPEVSRNILWRLLILNTACFAAFFGGRAITKDIELMPLFYCILQIVYLGIFKMLRMYDLSAGVADNLILTGTRGMISYDLNHRFLVCNTTALKIIPELKSANADKRLDESIEIFREIDGWIDEYEKDETNNTHTLNSGGAIYEVELEHLKENGKTEGYYIRLSDVTQEQKYIESINRYNAQMREAADRAISAEKAKSQFFARMSHEIRTPINAVLGMNEMILQESDDKKILDYAENIDSAGKTLLSVINDILDF